MSTDQSNEQRAQNALPAGEGWAVVTDYLLSGTEVVSARWGDVGNAGPLLTLHIGGLGLCVTAEQWQVIVDTVNAVLPQQVAA